MSGGPFTGGGNFLDNSFPANACPGTVNINVTGPAVDTQGIDFTILINGAFFGNTGCMTIGTFPIATPPMMTEIQIIGSTGCSGGGTAPQWNISGAG